MVLSVTRSLQNFCRWMVKLVPKYWAKARSSAAAIPWMKMCCFLGQQQERCIKKLWKPSLQWVNIVRIRLFFSLCNAVSPDFRRDRGSQVSADFQLYLLKHWQTNEDLILSCHPSYILYPFVWDVLGLNIALGNPIVKIKCLDSGFRKKMEVSKDAGTLVFQMS